MFVFSMAFRRDRLDSFSTSHRWHYLEGGVRTFQNFIRVFSDPFHSYFVSDSICLVHNPSLGYVDVNARITSCYPVQQLSKTNWVHVGRWIISPKYEKESIIKIIIITVTINDCS